MAEFVERLPIIFPVNIWSTYLFEIEHHWGKWLINFGSFAQRNALDQWSVFRSRRSVIQWILVQSGFDRSLIWKWICSKGTPQIRNPDQDSHRGTHPKRVLFTWIQVNSVSLEDFGFFKFIRKNVLYSVSGQYAHYLGKMFLVTSSGHLQKLINFFLKDDNQKQYFLRDIAHKGSYFKSKALCIFFETFFIENMAKNKQNQIFELSP